ncbi:KaiC domain-containing protein [Methanocella sp. CWC-04]|uniref:KaiC domain-containing protein n=2 Tax=Methanooceanicella nereidis TaxID=2052831 RepID=A0AAP2RH32_9EURY|nr:KaiC domain-containing protein [Methanocella sp. CWC-04]
MKLLSTGVNGLDELLHGGFPEKHMVVVFGGMGTGKSTLALQFIVNGLMKGEKTVYMSLEERENEIVESARGFGWDIQSFIDNNMLILIRLDPNDIKSTLSRIKNEMPKLIKSFGASRLVIDSITLFEMMFSDEAERRLNLFEIFAILKETGVTALITSEAAREDSYSTRYGLVEYVADGVIMLRYVRQDELRDVKLAVEVVKMRRHNHSRSIKPYDITNEGIVVHSESEVF